MEEAGKKNLRREDGLRGSKLGQVGRRRKGHHKPGKLYALLNL